MKPITDFKGIFPAALTMFDAAGNLDEKATWNHADWLVSQGVHGIVAAGSSGEFIALDHAERRKVIEIILDAVSGRVPVVASTGYYSTRKTIETTQWASDAGADAALVILPYYQKPPKAAVIEHFRSIRRESDLPVLVYNNPSYAGCEKLSPWEMAELADEKVIQGVKSTMATTAPVFDLKTLCPETFRIFYGSFREPLQGMVAGAHGWISGFLNFVPAEAVELYQATVVEQNIARAQSIWEKLVPFVQFYFQPRHGHASDLSIWRAGLEMLGRHSGFSRKPFLPLSKTQRDDLRQVMIKTGLLSEGNHNE